MKRSWAVDAAIAAAPPNPRQLLGTAGGRRVGGNIGVIKLKRADVMF